LVAFLAINCTDANLYHRNISPAQGDRVTLRGRVCTEDPLISQFPLRVLFLVDQSGGFNPSAGTTTGELFTTFDPEGARIRALRGLMGQYQRDDTVSFAVVGFGGTPQVLAPEEGSFTRNVGELENGISALAIPQSCLGEESCRDLRGALGTARAVIEGDLAGRSAGARAMTRYVVVLLLAGPSSPVPQGTVFCQRAIGGPACCDPERSDCQRDLRARICCPLNRQPCVPMDPMDVPYCCDPVNETCPPEDCSVPPADCATGVLVEDVRLMRRDFEEAGVASFHLHALHLAAETDPDPADGVDPNDAVGRLTQDIAFAGAGEFQAYYVGASIESASHGLHALQLLRPKVDLEAKDFVVFNLNALPGGSEAAQDSDADGLADDREAEHGTNPRDADTDDDGITDYVEVLIEYSPLAPDFPVVCAGLAPGEDSDADLLTDCDEALLGTDPSLLDSDGDAMPDRLEVTLGTDYVISDWLTDSDNDGVPNGDEVRQHTNPRSSDAADHLGTQYRYDIDDEGLQANIDVAQPRSMTGIVVQRGGQDSQGGLGWLCFHRADDGPGGSLCWLDAAERTEAGSRLSCAECDPRRPNGIGQPVLVTGDGSYELPSPSHGQPAPVTGVGGEETEDNDDEAADDGPRLLERSLAVEVSLSDLPVAAASEQLLVNRDERHCLSYVVRNVRLAATLGTVDLDEPGWNNIALYFAQAPQGRLTVPGIFRVAFIPVRFLDDGRREPPDAELWVWDDEFFRAGASF
jgi:hypothetical protein